MSVTVTRAGFLTTVQDLGRTGYRDIGVLLGGALDRHALQVANVLVANEARAAGLELTLGNVSLRFGDTRLVAWCGGDFTVEVENRVISTGRAALVHAGEELRIVPGANGGRAWLAISGGIDVPVVLGSRSTDLRNQFGGFEGRALRDGDVLRLGSVSARASSFAKHLDVEVPLADWFAPNEWSSTRPRHAFLRVIKGADSDRLHASAWTALVASTFRVAPESDRMGVRLEGAELAGGDHGELLSEAVAPGTIQLPPDGQPIVLLGDCQTIGGYPKIAHVITVDLAAAAQLRSGDVVRFAETTLAEAQRLLVRRERDFATFRMGVALQTA
jgi:antagonist of KipI